MLVLTINQGGSVYIGSGKDQIKVTYIGPRDQHHLYTKAVLGFEADRSINIVRAELIPHMPKSS